MTITVRSSKESVAAYKRLLLSDWKRAFPDEVVALLWSAVAGGRNSAQADSALDWLNPDARVPLPEAFGPALVRRIAGVTKVVRFADLPTLPDDYRLPRRPTKRASQ